MRREYFVHDGVKYTTGVGIKVKRNPYERYYTDGWFMFHDDVEEYITFQIRRIDNSLMQTKYVPVKDFVRMVGGTNGEFNNDIFIPYKVQLKDSQIDKLVIGWIVYIAAMIGSIIFKGFIGFWVCGSIAFYFWRKKVIEEEGYYVKWPI